MRAVCVAVAAALAVATSAAGAGGFTTPSLRVAHAATVQRLKASHLAYHWVACIETPHHFRGATVVRCNVNFGDPHIVAYCSVIRGRAVVTQFELRAIPCGPDLAGPQFTVTSSG